MSSKSTVILRGCVLAFGAAFANTGVVLATGTSVSHLTGDMAKLTISLSQWNPQMVPEVIGVASAAFAFLLGSTASGFFKSPTSSITKPLGQTVLWIGIIFFAASFLLDSNPTSSIALAAFACGLQNALANRYRGVVLRTTHLTGMFTDLGTHLGMRLRGHAIPYWKILVPALLITSFFSGGFIGAIAHFRGFDVLQLTALGYVACGALTTIRKYILPR